MAGAGGFADFPSRASVSVIDKGQERKGDYMTNTDICNMALSFLSKGKISSIDDNVEEAKQCKIHYEHCRKMLLRQYPWGFAKRVTKLAVLDEKVSGWNYSYAYPQQCLAVRYLFNDDNAETKEVDITEFDMAIVSDNQRTLLTDIENAWCEYIYDVKDVDMFSEEFVEALARLLASQMAMVLTGNANIQQSNYQIYQLMMEMAKTQNAQERRIKTEYPESYANARFQ